MSSRPLTVACLGSSSTAGKGQAFDWISALRGRPQNRDVRFENFGVGGDLAYDALQRVDRVIKCRPDKALVWVGGNDVLAHALPKLRRFFSLWKNLPQKPSPESYTQAMTAIVNRLQTQTSADIGICSLVPIGEDLVASEGLQATLNQLVADYSRIVREVAQAEECAYIPLYEATTAALAGLPRRAFTDFRFAPFYRDAFRALILRRTPDEIAERNGWSLHTDGIHLNSRGGLIAAALVQKFIDGGR